MHYSLSTCCGYNGKMAQLRSRKNWKQSSDTQSGFKPVLTAFTTSLRCHPLDRQATTHIQSHPSDKIRQLLYGDFESAITEYSQCLHTLANSHCLFVRWRAELRRATIPIFFDMMQCEYMQPVPNSMRIQGNFHEVKSHLFVDVCIGMTSKFVLL